jgi:cellulase/cellobiase CelA1
MARSKQSVATGNANAVVATPASALSNCKLDYIISHRTQNGLTAQFKIQNTGKVAVTNWSLLWQYAANVKISNSWGAKLTMQGGEITAVPMYFNQNIPVAGTIEFGTQLQFTGVLPEPHFFLKKFACY